MGLIKKKQIERTNTNTRTHTHSQTHNHTHITWKWLVILDINWASFQSIQTVPTVDHFSKHCVLQVYTIKTTMANFRFIYIIENILY